VDFRESSGVHGAHRRRLLSEQKGIGSDARSGTRQHADGRGEGVPGFVLRCLYGGISRGFDIWFGLVGDGNLVVGGGRGGMR